MKFGKILQSGFGGDVVKCLKKLDRQRTNNRHMDDIHPMITKVHLMHMAQVS